VVIAVNVGNNVKEARGHAWIWALKFVN